MGSKVPPNIAMCLVILYLLEKLNTFKNHKLTLDSLLGVCVANMRGMDAEPKATGKYLRRFAE